MNNVIIIVPTLNEKENIEILINQLVTTNIVFDLLFIDDNSNDGTQEVIKDLVKKNKISIIFLDQKKWVLVQLIKMALFGPIKKIIKRLSQWTQMERTIPNI